jgi:hypothetical protein
MFMEWDTSISVPQYQNGRGHKTKTAGLRAFGINGTLLILLPYKSSQYTDISDKDRMKMWVGQRTQKIYREIWLGDVLGSDRYR